MVIWGMKLLYNNRCLRIGAVSVMIAVVGACTSSKRGEGAADGSEMSSSSRPSTTLPRPITLLPPALDATAPADYPGVHNVVAYTDGFYSGSVPEGEAGLESLRAMGIKTIISVDGAKPEADVAAGKGMRYVHLPIGYNGITTERTLELSRVVKELPGPIYIHCHHGKHRSAGAAGAVAVTLNLAPREAMLGRMKVSGTAPNYTGLYAAVADATPATEAQLAGASNEFPVAYKTTGLVQSMVEIDEVFEHLKSIEKAGWAAPKDHPDLVPAAEAGRLENLFRALVDDADVKHKPAEFIAWLDRDAKTVGELEEALLAFKAGVGGTGGAVGGAVEDATGQGVTGTSLSAQFKKIGASCKECHVKYRDALDL